MSQRQVTVWSGGKRWTIMADRPRSQQKRRRSRRTTDFIVGKIIRKEQPVSWNARRFDPTSPNLRRHLRHKSKYYSGKFAHSDNSITEGEIQGLMELADEAKLEQLTFVCQLALQTLNVQKQLTHREEELFSLHGEFGAKVAQLRNAQDRIRQLEHTIDKIKDRRRERHAARAR